MSPTQPEDVLDRLMAQIHQRARQLPPGSYTTKLITGGVPAMGAKVTEEAGEVVEAAGRLSDLLAGERSAAAGLGAPESQREQSQRDESIRDEPIGEARRQVIYEAGDVLYHLWVLLGSFGITMNELRSELERREGTSGLEEKRRRKEPS